MSEPKTIEEWIATRPESVQKLVAEFPLGTVFNIEGRAMYLVGWNEDDTLILSKVNPHEDYDGAVASKEYIHASHLRDKDPRVHAIWNFDPPLRLEP